MFAVSLEISDYNSPNPGILRVDNKIARASFCKECIGSTGYQRFHSERFDFL